MSQCLEKEQDRSGKSTVELLELQVVSECVLTTHCGLYIEDDHTTTDRRKGMMSSPPVFSHYISS